MPDKSMQRIMTGVDTAAKQLKGPEDRVKELQALRAQVVKKKATDSYDPQMQLQDIDHEIARLTRSPQ